MGQFAEVLHLGPRDVEQLTVGEFEAFVEYLTRRDAAMRKETTGG
jgi:hypothetical protein